MSKPTHALMHLLHIISVAGPARVRAFARTSAPVLAIALGALFALALPTAASAETCPNEQLRSEANSTTLPDCRAYELVTPPFKEAGGFELLSALFGPQGLVAMAAGGSGIDGFSVGDYGDAQSGFEGDEYELTRTQSGWSERDIDLPESQFPASEPLRTTPELGAVLYEARAASQSYKAKDLWLREAGGALDDLGPFEPPADTEGPSGTGVGVIGARGGGEFLGASEDLSHVVFTTTERIGARQTRTVSWPGDGDGNLYEYTVGQSGPPGLVSVEPDEHPCQTPEDPYPDHQEPLVGDISGDGSKVFFECSGELLARVQEARTVAISEPALEDCSACDTANVEQASFLGASSGDGSKVFFATTQPLLGGETEPNANIYEYDFDDSVAGPGDPDGRIVKVTAGKWSPGGPRVQFREPSSFNPHPDFEVKISADGSHVYYVAQGKLEGASNGQGVEPIEDHNNLYVYDTQTGTTAFIGTLAPTLAEAPSTASKVGESPGSEEKTLQEFMRLSTITPDGRFLVFTSIEDLTPGDTSTARQVFEYDAETGELVRVSIGQNGFNDNGNTAIFNARPPRQDAGWPLAVSNDGAYVVFQSADGLTPGALNRDRGEFTRENINGELVKEPYYANNAYEYHDGNVYLISDGRDASYSSIGLSTAESSVQVRGISPSGDDIFFETADRLVPQDLDTEIDLYDARIDGGFPAPVSLLPSCSGDACQGQLSPSPTLLSPGSESQAGATPPLVTPAPAHTLAAKPKPKAKACKKGYVKKKTKCVKVKTKKKARKSSNNRRTGR